MLDVLLIAILGLAPLVFGGRYEGGKFVMVALVAAAMSVWTIRFAVDRSQHWHGSRALWLVAAGVLLLGLQLLPRGNTAPTTAVLLPTWAEDANADQNSKRWDQASFAPGETRGGMIMLLAYGGLFAIVIQRLRTIEDVEWILTIIAWTAVGFAVYGIVQYLTSNGLFWWFYEHPYRDTSDVVKGPFDNRNHFAHFLALGCGPLIWWCLSRANDKCASQNHGPKVSSRSCGRTNHALLIGSLAMSIVMFAVFMTFSRAGCALLLLVVFASTMAYLRLGWISKQFAAALVGIAALVAGALWIHGHERLAGRLSDYTGASLDSLDRGQARRKIWAANVEGIRHNGFIGAGVGSHRYLCPVYLKESPATEHTHAESGYLQVLLETGWPGLVLMLAGMAATIHCGLEVVRSRAAKNDACRFQACLVPLAIGLTASVLHSFVDFVWYITACMALTVVLAACVFRLYGLSRETASQRESGFDPPRWLRWCIVSSVVLVGTWMIHDRLGTAIASRAWDAYLCAQQAQHEGESTQSKIETLDAAIVALEEIVSWHPQHARANLRLANVYLQKFEQIQNLSDNAMPIAQLGEAVSRTGFASLAKRAIGNSNRDIGDVTRKLRDQWLERTLQFSVAAVEVIREFDADSDGVLAGAEVIAAQEECPILVNGAQEHSGPLTVEEVSAAYRLRYHEAFQYLYKALDCTRRGLSACPLQGEGYLVLAELCFLEDNIASQGEFVRRKRSLVNQALRLRPWDGDVLLVAGKEALFSNQSDLATKLWRRSFQSGPAHRARLIEVFLRQQIPLDYIAQQFAPVLDAAACELILQKYESAQLDTQSAKFFQHMATTARREAQTNGSNAGKLWLLAYKANVSLGNRTAQVDCAKNAAVFEPSDIGTRRRFAMIMMEQKLFEEAEPHVRWCLRREPNDRYLRNAVATILDARGHAAQKIELASGESDIPASSSRAK